MGAHSASTGANKNDHGAIRPVHVRTGELIELLPAPASAGAKDELHTDLRPVEEARRLWHGRHYVFFWISDALNVNAWQIAATGVAAGLKWWQAWLAVWAGYGVAAGFVVAMARPGSVYHIPFPIAARAAFGRYGAFWPVINRVLIATVWFSCQTWLLAQCVQLALRALYADVGEQLPAWMENATSLNALEFMSFILAWLITLPAIWYPPESMRHLFMLKAVLVPIAGVAFLSWMGWKVWNAPEGVPGNIMDGPIDVPPTQMSKSVWLSAAMACIGNSAAVIINAPDFSRFSVSPAASMKPQLFAMPAAFALTTLVGIAIASCSGKIYDHVYWSPLEVLAKFLAEGGIASRLGVLGIALALALAQIGTNVAANSLAAGTDLAALAPNHITVRLGGFLCAGGALMLRPWHFFATENSFTGYLSAYSVFLSAIAGVLAADYYVVRRGYFSVPHLYSKRKFSLYMYGGAGVNWRAYAAYLVGVLPNLCGFMGLFGWQVPTTFAYIYQVDYFAGFVFSFMTYYALCQVFPLDGVPSSGWFENPED